MVTHYTSLDGVNLENTWLTIGSYDGVHIGHQQLISALNHNAHQAGGKSVVLTFFPHPTMILKGRIASFYLTTPLEKVKLLDDLGTDIVITHPFTTDLSQTSAREFITYLKQHLGFKELWAGNDFVLGKGREGNINYLELLGNEHSFKVHVFNPISFGGKKISSSNIRCLLKEGLIEEANELLGRPYQVTGEVIHGDGRGKSIGIPTANLEIWSDKLIPGFGVYACRAHWMGKNWSAAVNIGIRPTFDNSDPKMHIEAHIIDFSDDIYTQQISLQFFSRLRGEKRFLNVDELIMQVHEDIYRTRDIFTKY